MRILFVVSDLSAIGGIQQYGKKFIKALKDFGTNVKTHELRGLGLRSKVYFAISFFWKSLWFAPDIIVCTHVTFSPLALWVKKFLGRRYSVVIHGIEVMPIKNSLEENSLREAEIIINNFDRTAAEVARQLPEVKNNFFKLTNSVDGKRFFIKEKSPEFLKKFGLTGKKIILTVCRISIQDGDLKGYERVMRAMPKILKAVPDAVYLLVGQGDDLPRVKELASDLKLGGNVVFAGVAKDEELVEYYNLADVFVYPSKNEGFPAIVLLEALACGKPVIGGNQPGSESKLWQTDAGLIVPSDDISAIGSATIKVLEGRAQKTLYDRGYLRERILNEYGVERYKEHVRAFINRAERK